MIIINLATIDFGGGGGSSKPLITEPLIANIWSRGRKVFTPANYNVDGFSDVTINTAVIGDNSALDFSIIGWDDTDSNNVNSIYNADITHSEEVLDKWNNEQISNFNGDTKLVYCPLIDTSNVTNLYNFFNGCNNLQFIPQLNTSNATNMSGMFGGCESLRTIPMFDTSKIINMTQVFLGCTSLISIPQLDTSKVTKMTQTFYSCSSLESIPAINTENVTEMNNMFSNCSSLTTIPLLNTSNVTNMWQTFYGCSSLQSLPLLNFQSVNNINTFFGYITMSNLTDLGGFKDLKIDWNDTTGLAKCPNLTYQSVMNVLNNLYDFRVNGDDTTTRTIKLNSNSYNLLTADDIAMANAKGWNVTK